MGYINPDEILSFPPRTIFNLPDKLHMYDKMFSCANCDDKCLIIFETCCRDLFCRLCLEGGANDVYAIWRNDDAEQIQSIFVLIREFPSILNNASVFLR